MSTLDNLGEKDFLTLLESTPSSEDIRNRVSLDFKAKDAYNDGDIKSSLDHRIRAAIGYEERDELNDAAFAYDRACKNARDMGFNHVFLETAKRAYKLHVQLGHRVDIPYAKERLDQASRRAEQSDEI